MITIATCHITGRETVRHKDHLGIEEMVKEINENGMLEPINIRLVIRQDWYKLSFNFEVVDGLRRLLAMEKLDMRFIEAEVIETLYEGFEGFGP